MDDIAVIAALLAGVLIGWAGTSLVLTSSLHRDCNTLQSTAIYGKRYECVRKDIEANTAAAIHDAKGQP